MPRELQPCGTYAAWQRHKKNNEDPCESCWRARRQYQRAYRKVAPRSESDRRKAHRRAHRRALVALSQRYSTAFLDLLGKELAKEGLTK